MQAFCGEIIDENIDSWWDDGKRAIHGQTR